MSVEPGFKKISQPNLRQGWQVMALLSLVALFIEVAEKNNFFQMEEHSNLILEILFHSLFTPFVGFIFLAILERAERERFHLSLTIRSQKAFRERLAGTKKLDEVIQVVLRFPFEIAPITGVGLYLLIPDSNRLELAGVMGKDTESLASVEGMVPRSFRIEATSNHYPTLPHREACPLTPLSGSYRQRCLKLYLAEKHIGQLLLLFPADEPLSEKQGQFFEGLAPEITLALDGAMWKRRALQQRQMTEEEKWKIAQDLHDILGQDLAILLRKLEMLREDHSLKEFRSVRQDLGQMVDITDQAYQMVRGTLAALEPSISGELEAILREYSDWVRLRSSLQFEFISVGQPIPVTDDLKNQVFLIFREALTNIEKHAKAWHVKIRLQWTTDCLNLVISDNGRGFNLEQANLPGHYGLFSMKDRANQLGGEIKLESKINVGTEVNLYCPLKRTDNPLTGAGVTNLIREVINGTGFENLSR